MTGSHFKRKLQQKDESGKPVIPRCPNCKRGCRYKTVDANYVSCRNCGHIKPRKD